MNNGVVYFFSGDDHGWWVTDIQSVDHGFRGFVRDGCFWLDYHLATSTINICISHMRNDINWDKPINIIKGRKVLNTIPVTIDSVDYLEIQRWAKAQNQSTTS